MSFARYLAQELKDNLTFFGPTDGPYSVRANKRQLEAFHDDYDAPAQRSRAKKLNSFEVEFGSDGDLLDYKCYMAATPMGFSNVAVDCDDALGTEFATDGEALALINDMQCGAALAGLVKSDHCRDLDQFMGDY